METATVDTTASNSVHCRAPSDMSSSKKSIDLDLLSGTTPITELPISQKEPKEQASHTRGGDEISMLTDPFEHANHTVVHFRKSS
jgi:hypothetical protein